jgi:uncharacterized membrane protein
MSRRPPAAPLVIAGGALAGIAISAYLTISHYQGIPLACAANSTFDCGAVTSSVYSVLPGTGIPVSLLGIGWFLVSGALALATLRRPGRRTGAWLEVGWCFAGLAFVLYLVYAELVVIHRICEWCTAVHLLVLMSLLAALAGVSPDPDAAAPEPEPGPRPG